MSQAAAWQQRPEAGSTRGIRFLMWVARHLGRQVLHAMLWPVAGYFLLMRAPERRASRAFLSRVFDRPARWWQVLYHFHVFARATADRFYFLASPEKVPVRFVTDAKLHELLDEGRAGLFLAAHFGSFEAARVLGPELGGIQLRIVLDKALGARFMAVLAEVHPQMADMIIDSEQDSVALGLSIGDALQAGDWVGFLADRHRAGDRTVQVNFLGAPAQFPVGPYLIAALFKAPVICAFSRFERGQYQVHCEVLTTAANVPRKDRQQHLQALAQAYADRLAHHVLATPYAWFNFYDFWQDDNA